MMRTLLPSLLVISAPALLAQEQAPEPLQTAVAATEPQLARPGAAFVTLDGGGLAPLGGRERRFLLAANALGGYDSAFAGVPRTAGEFSGGGLFAAAFLETPRHYLVVQNNTNLLQANTSGGLFEYFNSTGFTFGSTATRTRSWTATVENGIGNNAVRAIAPVDTAAAGSLSVPSPDTPLFALKLGTVVSNDAGLAFAGENSRHGGWRLALRNSYRTVSSEAQGNDTIRLRAEYDLRPSARTGWGFFEETARQSGAQDCTTEAAGLTLQRQAGERTTVQLAGGPAWGSAGCVVRLTGDFQGSATTNLRRSLSLYAAGARQLNQSVLSRTTWQTTGQGGLIQRFGVSWQARGDGGYLQGTQPGSVGNFSGSFVGGSLERTFRGGPVLALVARRFSYSGEGATIPSRSQVFVSFGWSGARHRAVPTPKLTGADAQ